MDPSDDYNPSDGIHLFQSYFPVDESESFLLRDDSTSNLSFPCFQQGLSDTPDANCDISGAESSVDSTIIRTRNDSIDSNGIVSDALLSDINPIGIHDLQLISSSFSHCVLPVCQPLKRIHTVCGDMAKSRMGFLTKKDKRSRLSSAMKPIRHDCRFGDVYQCSSDRDCFFVFSKRHMDYLRSGHSRFSTIWLLFPCSVCVYYCIIVLLFCLLKTYDYFVHPMRWNDGNSLALVLILIFVSYSMLSRSVSLLSKSARVGCMQRSDMLGLLHREECGGGQRCL